MELCSRASPIPLLALLPILACCSNRAAAVDDAALDDEALDALQRATPGTPKRLWLNGARIVGIAVTVERSALPENLRRIGEGLLPQGELTFVGREWSPSGNGWRIEREVQKGTVRTVLLDQQGLVLERTHEKPIEAAPKVSPPISDAGTLTSCEVVQTAPGLDRFRLSYRSDDGATLVVDCERNGDVRAKWRLLHGIDAQLRR